MRVLSLIYHDVTAVARRADSGFHGPGADRYKLTPEQFEQHLDAVAATGLVPGLVTDEAAPARRIFLTFDDGGRSAATTIAPMLAERGWLAHFFIPTARIGSTGFVDRAALEELRAAGHVVGSHSHTHPYMTKLRDDEIAAEWRTSRDLLEDIVGSAVTAASVPTGFYAARVGRVAADAGFRHVFTSEPWLRPRELGPAAVYGRFSITEDTSPERVEALCRFAVLPICREAALWQSRKAARTVLGPAYGRLRHAILARRHPA